MKSLYEMEQIELIHQKDMVLTDLTTCKMTYKKEEAVILLTTDFKELKLTNEKMRQAYINQQLLSLKEQIERLNNSLAIINDLIDLRIIEKGGEP